ncbi:putative complex I intermediate-associated protein 30 [Sesamum alatum]|uniref:Complex I intermediate-associated protein 30 n=1 Tax=Sesamum alatum TaxID=300844 RepID=A0AAE1YBY9_9LAMI|nr:putative complex I intermediate-associated protein 30 [Sesamum alatum]
MRFINYFANDTFHPLVHFLSPAEVFKGAKFEFGGRKGNQFDPRLLLLPLEFSQKTVEKMSRFRALWQASINATKRALTWNLEDLVPPSERYIFKFDTKEELKRWHLYSDSEYGGLSSASLEIKDSANGSSGTGVFSGNLSLDVDESSRWNISRSGFCGMRSKKFDGFIDLDAYDTLALKVKGDGRCYISTIYTENWVNSPGQQEDNSWQAFVFVPEGNWYIAKIPLARYLPTWRGNVIDAKLEMNPSRVVGMSLSVNAEGGVPGARSGPGDFRVEIDWIKALRMQS